LSRVFGVFDQMLVDRSEWDFVRVMRVRLGVEVGFDVKTDVVSCLVGMLGGIVWSLRWCKEKLAAKLTPLNSFGLQIGSVKSKIRGPLYYSGYDQSRICGNISTQQGAFAGIEPNDDGRKGQIDLLDIAINAFDGSSPFNTSIISNLLTSSNSSVGPDLLVATLPEAWT
jgi:hypothetical protein